MSYDRLKLPSPRDQYELFNFKKYIEAGLEDPDEDIENEKTYYETIMNSTSKANLALIDVTEDLGPWEDNNQKQHSILTKPSPKKMLNESASSKILRSPQQKPNHLTPRERRDSKDLRGSPERIQEQRYFFPNSMSVRQLNSVFDSVSQSSAIRHHEMTSFPENSVVKIETPQTLVADKTGQLGSISLETQNHMITKEKDEGQDGPSEELPYNFSRISRRNTSEGGVSLMWKDPGARPETMQQSRAKRLLTATVGAQTESSSPQNYIQNHQNAQIQTKLTTNLKKMKRSMRKKQTQSKPSFTLEQQEYYSPIGGLSPREMVVGNSISLKKPEHSYHMTRIQTEGYFNEYNYDQWHRDLTATEPGDTDRKPLKIDGIGQPVGPKPKFKSRSIRTCNHHAEQIESKGNIYNPGTKVQPTVIPFAKKSYTDQAESNQSIKDTLKILKKISYNQAHRPATSKQESSIPKRLFVIKKFNPKFFTVTIEASPKADQFKLSFLSPNRETPEHAILNVQKPQEEPPEMNNTHVKPRTPTANHSAAQTVQTKTKDSTNTLEQAKPTKPTNQIRKLSFTNAFLKASYQPKAH